MIIAVRLMEIISKNDRVFFFIPESFEKSVVLRAVLSSPFGAKGSLVSLYLAT